MKIIDKEDQMMIREGWLADRDVTEADVMEDEKGEYVMEENEVELDLKFTKVYLPENLQGYPF
jgi:hypothetical protein